MYIIRRINDNKMVSVSGSDDSYTNNLQKAQVFTTYEQAKNNRCIENEYIDTVESLLNIK